MNKKWFEYNMNKIKVKMVFKKLIFYCVILVMFLFNNELVMANSVRAKVKDGNKLYYQKKYDQALTKYQDALLSEPKNERIEFNVANSLYMKKKYEDALKSYQKVIGSKDIALEQQAYFNIGNTFYRMGKLPESILAYQQALKLNPDDMDAKYNLEYVRKKLKQQMEKQQQQQQQQGQRTDQKDKQQEDKSQAQSNEEKEQQKEEQKQAQTQTQQKELSKEEAERILNALKYDEKDIQKKRKMIPGGEYKVEKDW